MKYQSAYSQRNRPWKPLVAAIACFSIGGVALTSTVVQAADCPFLTAQEVVQTLLDPPRKVTYEVTDLKGQNGMKRARQCHFTAPGPGVGSVGVEVIDFVSASAATAHYQKLRKDTGGKIFPLSGVGNAAFIANIPGLSDTTYVQAGSRVLRVAHVLSPKVKAAIANSPDEGVVGTHELAKLAVKRL